MDIHDIDVNCAAKISQLLSLKRWEDAHLFLDHKPNVGPLSALKERYFQKSIIHLKNRENCKIDCGWVPSYLSSLNKLFRCSSQISRHGTREVTI